MDNYVKQSVTEGRCDIRPTVTFPAKEHCHCPWLVYSVPNPLMVED